MKRIFKIAAFGLLTTIFLVGCSNSNSHNNNGFPETVKVENSHELVPLVTIESKVTEGINFYYSYDPYSKVVYVGREGSRGFSLTALLNADGTPVLFEEGEIVRKYWDFEFQKGKMALEGYVIVNEDKKDDELTIYTVYDVKTLEMFEFFEIRNEKGEVINSSFHPIKESDDKIKLYNPKDYR